MTPPPSVSQSDLHLACIRNVRSSTRHLHLACNRHVTSTTRHKSMCTRKTQAPAGGAPPRRAVTSHTVTVSTSRECTAWPTSRQPSRNRRFRRPPGGATACPNSGSSLSRANWIATASISAAAATTVASSHARRTTDGHGAASRALHALRRLAGAAKRRTFEQLFQRSTLVWLLSSRRRCPPLCRSSSAAFRRAASSPTSSTAGSRRSGTCSRRRSASSARPFASPAHRHRSPSRACPQHRFRVTRE